MPTDDGTAYAWLREESRTERREGSTGPAWMPHAEGCYCPDCLSDIGKDEL